MTETALWTFLHLLVLVYWLGGDLGAFYASRFLSRPGVSADKRLLAAKIVGDVDMAPRTALIAALPTGLTLASVKGWMELDAVWLGTAWAASILWAGLVWRLHLKPGGAAALKSLDSALRWALAAGLLAAAGAGVLGHWGAPLFIELKLALLGAAILTGLAIRRVLRPLGAALAGLAGPDPQAAEQALAHTMTRARGMVMIIWLLIVSAAIVGVAGPTNEFWLQ